ncbi:IS5 family transposase [Desulfohalovibrio reitneri]|uniref:IS5 family transposase n=1 Tax=Desulfohalovibrio reitneri TaxID=1307759 RepID=UPI001F00F8A3|nr:IS5 family transposase [Desulfohalovibrio reitneri]
MKAKPAKSDQGNFLYEDLIDQLNPKDPLLKLAANIPWERFEQEFSSLYSEYGRPAKPIRLMVGLMILKQLENLSDERVIEAWVRNPYYQAFCGETHFRWRLPCDPTDLVYFRKRIGEGGARLIFEVSVGLHGDDAMEREIAVDTTVQEKNITFPTDVKLLTKVIKRCRAIAEFEGISLRRSFRRELPGLLRQRFKSRKIIKRIRTMAGVLIRELERKLPRDSLARHREAMQLFRRVHDQKRTDKNKIYSLHEPDVLCIGKGKEHKKYEFGRKASIAWTKTTGVIVGAMSFKENVFDGHTLPDVLEQVSQITESCPEAAICDRGYRGRKKVGDTSILIPGRPKKSDTPYQRRKARQRFRRRAGIEPVIGHLKHDFRMAKNFLKGALGDAINLLMAAAAFNFKKWMRGLKHFLSLFAPWLCFGTWSRGRLKYA